MYFHQYDVKSTIYKFKSIGRLRGGGGSEATEQDGISKRTLQALSPSY